MNEEIMKRFDITSKEIKELTEEITSLKQEIVEKDMRNAKYGEDNVFTLLKLEQKKIELQMKEKRLAFLEEVIHGLLKKEA
jgi:predicted ribosome-associated RNA-binding protein Tma20